MKKRNAVFLPFKESQAEWISSGRLLRMVRMRNSICTCRFQVHSIQSREPILWPWRMTDKEFHRTFLYYTRQTSSRTTSVDFLSSKSVIAGSIQNADWHTFASPRLCSAITRDKLTWWLGSITTPWHTVPTRSVMILNLSPLIGGSGTSSFCSKLSFRFHQFWMFMPGHTQKYYHAFRC